MIDMRVFRFLAAVSMAFMGRLSASWMPEYVAAWGLVIVFVLTLGLWVGDMIYTHRNKRRNPL